MTPHAEPNSLYYHRISWDQVPLSPVIVLKDGIQRTRIPLQRQETESRADLLFQARGLELRGRWEDLDGSTSRLCFTLTNTSQESVRLARLLVASENGLEDYLGKFQTKNISFFRNGHQSWSTARTYRSREKPLRPWLQLVSLATSNLANLPSNVPGLFNSEMYAVVSDLTSEESFLIGQGPPFNQFFYICLNLFSKDGIRSFFELTFDFGRKMFKAGDRIELDGIVMSRGKIHEILDGYFLRIRDGMNLAPKTSPKRGWCSWYFYYNRISPDIIRENLRSLQERKIDVDFVQIDDGYQTMVGDWLTQRPEFVGRMGELADSIRSAGYLPGLWVAPFIADGASDLLRTHPDYALRSEYGKRLLGGYGVFWKGKFYYGLDITHPRFEEYIRKVIRTMVHDWGYGLLKCDFLFGGSLRGGTHRDITFSRAEVLKKGMEMIREEAGSDVFIIGCGMPLSAGIGMVDAMRVGPDTGPFWIYRTGKLFRTGAMVGVRNSVRNTLVRSPMHSMLWMNDPDCVMVRDRHTKLSPDERLCQINAAILSGGLLTYSDDVAKLSDAVVEEITKINILHDECSLGRLYALDLMEREVPELVYNTSGYLGLFNFREVAVTRQYDLSFLDWYTAPVSTTAGISLIKAAPVVLEDVWTGERFSLPLNGIFSPGRLPRHSSRLFRIPGKP